MGFNFGLMAAVLYAKRKGKKPRLQRHLDQCKSRKPTLFLKYTEVPYSLIVLFLALLYLQYFLYTSIQEHKALYHSNELVNYQHYYTADRKQQKHQPQTMQIDQISKTDSPATSHPLQPQHSETMFSIEIITQVVLGIMQLFILTVFEIRILLIDKELVTLKKIRLLGVEENLYGVFMLKKLLIAHRGRSGFSHDSTHFALKFVFRKQSSEQQQETDSDTQDLEQINQQKTECSEMKQQLNQKQEGDQQKQQEGQDAQEEDIFYFTKSVSLTVIKKHFIQIQTFFSKEVDLGKWKDIVIDEVQRIGRRQKQSEKHRDRHEAN